MSNKTNKFNPSGQGCPTFKMRTIMAQFVKTIPFSLEAYNEIFKASGMFPKLITTSGNKVYQLKVFNLRDGTDMVVGLMDEEHIRVWDSNGQSDRSNGYPLKIITEEFDGSEFVATND